ncbi:MAG: hypothetical protein K5985_12270 [Lachnospiraceae bacterium]|nr:hypothetical protein [Lachnospiraceae bacterium]
MIFNNWEVELKSGKTKLVSMNVTEEGAHEHDTSAVIDAERRKEEIFEGVDALISNGVHSTLRIKDTLFNVDEIASISCTTVVKKNSEG